MADSLSPSPNTVHDKLYIALSSLRFTGSKNDHSFFVKNGQALVFILVYVDDILVTGPHPQACKETISQLSNLFPIKDLGPLHYFLGIEVKRSSSGIFISQTKYIIDLLKKSNMIGAKPCATPLSISSLDHESPLLSDPIEYRSLVAEYRSLANTAADITYICKLLVDVGLQLPCPPQIWCDNISAISLAKNLIFHVRTKHVEIDYHYIREKVLSKAVSVHFINTQAQIADICTKSISKTRFHLLRDKLSLHTPRFSLRGDNKGSITSKDID
ncbi:unnamed protein product [Malus baccata var. baccata]